MAALLTPIHTRLSLGLAAVLCLLSCVSARGADAQSTASSAQDATSATFDLLELRVLGNTTLDNRSIEAAVYPFLGPAKNLESVEAARAALERTYHDHGLQTVFVDIPEQTVDQGIVRLHVTEGRLRQVRLTGAHYFSGRIVRAQLPAATENTVPDVLALQRQLTALNAQTPDRVVVPVLKAGPTPGTVDLALRTEDHVPFHGSVELNNQYTVDTTHLRAALSASYDNLFGRLDSLSAQYQVSPESPQQSHVIAGTYLMRLGSAGSSLSFQYINSKSDVASVGALGILGSGSAYGLHWLLPLPATGSVQSLTLGVDYKDFGQSILVSANSGFSTPVKYLNLSAAYAGARASAQAQWNWNATVNVGGRGVFDNLDQFADKRYQAQPNYFYLRTGAGLTQQLPARFSVSLQLTGQAAIDPLINNEQLAFGGASSVRGYLEAEELGDSGVRSSLQFGAPPLDFDAGRLHLNEFLFYDLGHAILNQPLPNQASSSDLRSWGAGVGMQGFGHFDGILTWAYPLLNGIDTLKGQSTLLFVLRGTW